MTNTVKVAIVAIVALIVVVGLLLRLRYHSHGAGRIRSHLRDENPQVRISALHAVGAQGLMEFIDELRPLLQTEHDPAVLDALMIEILTAPTGQVSTRKLVELRSWAVERQNRVHAGLLPSKQVIAHGRTSPAAAPVPSRGLGSGPVESGAESLTPSTERVDPTERVEDSSADIADVDLWEPEPSAELPVFVVANEEPIDPTEEPGDGELEVQNSLDSAMPELEVEGTHAPESNEELAVDVPADLDGDDGRRESSLELTSVLDDWDREAAALDDAARRQAEAIATAAAHEAASLSQIAQREAEQLAREAERAAQALTEAAAREAQLRLHEAADEVAAMKREAETAAAAILERAEATESQAVAALQPTTDALIAEAEAEADALIEAARLAARDLLERSRSDAEVILTNAADEGRVLVESAQSDVAAVEAQAAGERRALLDATYEACRSMIEKLSVRDAVAATEARALLESWRHGSHYEGVSSAPEQPRADMGDDPEHLVVIVKSPSEIARAEKKAREKAKKKAKKRAKREREQARAKAAALAEAERERLRLNETAPETAVIDSVSTATTAHLLGVEPTQRLSLLRPEDDQPR